MEVTCERVRKVTQNILKIKQNPVVMPFAASWRQGGVSKISFHNVAVEGVSKLSFQCGSRDAKFCVSTIWLNKLLILNVLYVVADIETRHATSLLMAKSHFDL